MEKIIFILLCAAELVMTAIRLRSGGRHHRAYSHMRIAAFAVCAVSVLAGLVQLGIRWVGLAVLLFVWAALGIATLRQPARGWAASFLAA